MHNAGANTTLVGVPAPEGRARDTEEEVTEKSEVLTRLASSFAHVRSAVESMPDSVLDSETVIFRRTSSVRGVYLLVANHMHEQFGQAIACARVNGVVPPWSRKGE